MRRSKTQLFAACIAHHIITHQHHAKNLSHYNIIDSYVFYLSQECIKQYLGIITFLSATQTKITKKAIANMCTKFGYDLIYISNTQLSYIDQWLEQFTDLIEHKNIKPSEPFTINNLTDDEKQHLFLLLCAAYEKAGLIKKTRSST